MIKIVSGSTIPVGSTVALVNLCNQLNSRGFDTLLFGPHRWHLDKCKSGTLADFHLDNTDMLILHDIRLLSLSDLYDPVHTFWEQKKSWIAATRDTLSRRFSNTPKPQKLKLIYTCQSHATSLLKRSKLSLVDSIHYSCNALRTTGKIKRPGFVCPRFVNDLKGSEHKPHKVAGVIGSVRKENDTVVSIEKALSDGMEKVVIYGYLFDPTYFYDQIEPLAKKYPGKIKFAGFVDDQQYMYDSISHVYCSADKPWSRLKQECLATNTIYSGPETLSDNIMVTNDEILGMWAQALEL